MLKVALVCAFNGDVRKVVSCIVDLGSLLSRIVINVLLGSVSDQALDR